MMRSIHQAHCPIAADPRNETCGCDSFAPSVPANGYEAWKRMVVEFFREADRPGTTLEQVEAGHKALTLAWFGLDISPTPLQEVEVVAIFSLAGKRVLRAEREALRG